MQIDRVIYPVTTLGPGERVAIWTVGCTKRCPFCASRELWAADPGREIEPEALAAEIARYTEGQSVDGVTVTGGDPLEQPEELLILLRELRRIASDILVYTGYTYEELCTFHSPGYMAQLRRLASVLIDGRYLHARNDDRAPLRGSTNQRILYFDRTMLPRYTEYLRQGRKIQNVFYGDSLISVGIHNKEAETGQ